MTPLGKYDMYYVSEVEHVQTAFSLLTAGSKRIRLLVAAGCLSFFNHPNARRTMCRFRFCPIVCLTHQFTNLASS